VVSIMSLLEFYTRHKKRNDSKLSFGPKPYLTTVRGKINACLGLARLYAFDFHGLKVHAKGYRWVIAFVQILTGCEFHLNG
jgi:hypothetical protein